MSIETAIAEACWSAAPFTKARQKALSRVKWVIADNAGHYLICGGVTEREQFTGDKSQATIYDGRDSHVTKLKFFTAMTGRKLHAEIL